MLPFYICSTPDDPIRTPLYLLNFSPGRTTSSFPLQQLGPPTSHETPAFRKYSKLCTHRGCYSLDAKVLQSHVLKLGAAGRTFRKVGPTGRSSASLGHARPFWLTFASRPWSLQFCSGTHFCHDVLPYPSPHSKMPTDQKLKPQLWAKRILFFLWVDYLRYLLEGWKVDKCWGHLQGVLRSEAYEAHTLIT